jgi:signal recognition particle subunit SRP54
MLDNLRTGLRSALKKIVGASDINEEIIDSLCKNVQRALLQSDVNVRLVLSATDNLKSGALKEHPVKGLKERSHHYNSLLRASKIARLYRGNDRKH